MKRINLSYILFSCMLFAFWACSEEEENMVGTGTIQFVVTPQAPVVVTKADELPVTVTVNSKAEGWFKEYTNFTSGEDIELKAGSYVITAIAGKESDKPGFDPCYKTTSTAATTVTAGKTVKKTLFCYLTTAKVSVVYSEDVKTAFAGYAYETVVSGATGALSFGESEERGGYFAPGDLSVTFRYRTGGEWIEYSLPDILDTRVKNHYKLTLSLKESDVEGDIGAGSIQLEIEETNDRDVSVEIKLPRTTLKPNAWAKFAYLKGEIEGKTDPSGVSFEWRKQGEDNWTAEYDVKETDGIFQVLLDGLDPDTEYEYRIAGGNIVEFKTQDIPAIPNLNFDTWTTGPSGKRTKWYPNADLSNSYWATGNEGVLLMGDANTIGVDDGSDGMYAEMTSVKISIVGFAAGNLYTGTYKTEISSPIKSARFGRDYTGRPTKLSGYFKYTPQEVNIVEKKEVAAGYMDKCEIYVRLFQDIPGTADGRYDGATVPENPIAYGTFSTDQEVTEWTYFEIPILYNDLETIPTKIAIVASSSIDGAFFTGGVGSKLCVDNFELSFDYDPAIEGE